MQHSELFHVEAGVTKRLSSDHVDILEVVRVLVQNLDGLEHAVSVRPQNFHWLRVGADNLRLLEHLQDCQFEQDLVFRLVS